MMKAVLCTVLCGCLAALTGCEKLQPPKTANRQQTQPRTTTPQSTTPPAATPASPPAAQQASKQTPVVTNTQSPSSNPAPQTQPPPAQPSTTPVQVQNAPATGDYAILMGTFASRIEASDSSRSYRRQRINNFVEDRGDGVYRVLVGPFPNEAQARRQMEKLYRKGYLNATLFRMPGR